MNDVFISYARGDAEHARSLAGVLSERGLSVWWDREIPPGASFDDTIEQALADSRCVVVLWSRESISSRWVRTEASEALSRGALVPVLLEPVVPPLEFRRIEAADLSDWTPGPPHPELDALLSSLDRMLGRRVLSTAPATEHARRSPSPATTIARRRATGALLAIAVVTLVLAYAGWSYFENSRPALRNQQNQTTRLTPSIDAGPRLNVLSEVQVDLLIPRRLHAAHEIPAARIARAAVNPSHQLQHPESTHGEALFR